MSITDKNTDRALLVLRLTVAAIFIAHGYQKLFVMGHAGVEGFFTQLGIPMPGISAWAITALEFGGGILLAVGFYTRVLSLLFVADMAGAILFALLPKGFVGGYEFEFLLGVGALALALGGAGAYSADARMSARKA